MPEGPEIYNAAQVVNSVCQGKIFSGKVVKSEVSTKNPDIDWDEPAYTITGVSRGKEVKLCLTAQPEGKKKMKNIDIIFHFGMSGKFELQNKSEMAKHSHLNFFMRDENKVLSFIDYRRFGKWKVTSEWDVKRGPCVLQDYKAFRQNVLKSIEASEFQKPICEVLLNQKYFNGIGNYLRAEILYRSRIPPFESAYNVLKPLKDAEENDVKIKQPDILSLCTKLPNEVITLNVSNGYFNNPSNGENYEELFQWLQCYDQDGMSNLVDHNGRTIWYSGPAGPLKPKDSRSRGKKNRKNQEKNQTAKGNQKKRKSEKELASDAAMNKGSANKVLKKENIESDSNLKLSSDSNFTMKRMTRRSLRLLKTS